jgi:hypothetical protein
MIESMKEKDHVFKEVANEKGIKLHHDTHYDAMNYEFEKWNQKDLLRLDFQPLPEGIIVVTKLTDHFPCLPKFLRWCWLSIPMFPYLAKIEHEKIGEIRLNQDNKSFKGAVLEMLAKAL